MNQQNWQQLSHTLQLDGRALIDGQRVDALSGERFEKLSPVDGRFLGTVARCGAPDADLAVQTARRNVDNQSWSGQPPASRKRTLQRFASLIWQHADELALTETLDMGKPIQYSLSIDVKASANCINWYAEAIDKLYGEIAPTASDSLALVTREPVGVVAAIVPWNYPMIMSAWKIAPALASGNSVILKPSERSPFTAMRLAELALEAGLPPGVFNVLPGFGHEVGAALARHMQVDCIAFTGSTAVGKQIMQMAGSSNLKRVWTELGGKSANIVCADCPDIDTAVRAAISSLCFNQGQSCNAPTRLYLETSIKQQFLTRAMTLLPEYQPANPLQQNTTMGALVDQRHLQQVLDYIHGAQKEGARLLSGGNPCLLDSGGQYLEPCIFDQVEPHMAIAREEVFGPVLSVFSFTDIHQAIQAANHSRYGLQAAVWTSQLSKAITCARALQAGTVHINQYDGDDITVPFGGVKESGNGRDKSLHSFDKYTELKTTWIKI